MKTTKNYEVEILKRIIRESIQENIHHAQVIPSDLMNAIRKKHGLPVNEPSLEVKAETIIEKYGITADEREILKKYFQLK